MHESRDQIINWLNDAVGMEENQVQVLGNHVNDFKDYPQIRQQIQAHLDLTKQQADMLRQAIKQLGGSPSGMKQAVGKVQGVMAGVSTAPAGDELVKNLLADYAAEHFEIACYNSLISACDTAGETSVSSVCRTILSQEEEMATRIMDVIPMVTKDYLVQKGHKKAA